jgi:hypothetical protein
MAQEGAFSMPEGTLRENKQVLRRDGREPSRVGAYTLHLIREGEGAEKTIKIVLRCQPWPEVLWEWSKALDPDLDEVSEIIGLIETALLELDGVLGFYRSRITSVEVKIKHVPQRNAKRFFMDLVLQGQGGQSIPTHVDSFVERVHMEVEEADRIRVTTSQVFL